VRAIVLDVKKSGSRVKIILSRTHPEFVRRLFELEIPEVGEHIIEVRSLAREAGYRSKVAVSCIDSKIDCVGACVGVRGSRIKSVVDELAGERIDIVRWNDSLQVLVPNALQPAEVEDVILCPMLGKVIVLVREDQLSLAIGKKGQNVRLASKLVGWDIHVLTQERLDEQLDKSVTAFSAIPSVSEELAENLVAQGFFSFDDLSVIEPDQLAELGGLTAEECDAIVAYADEESARLEQEERRLARLAEAARLQEAKAEAAAREAEDAAAETSEQTAEDSDQEIEQTTDETVLDDALHNEADDGVPIAGEETAGVGSDVDADAEQALGDANEETPGDDDSDNRSAGAAESDVSVRANASARDD
jgi:N utilization substance protein A